MGEVIPFRRPKSGGSEPHRLVAKGCRHEWQRLPSEGPSAKTKHTRSVAEYRCKRCGAYKTIVR